MITSLSIENFALIEKLSIDFSGGFSTITGETGAGKSILLGALGLALGKRADLTSLKNKDEKCIIEANFRISQYELQDFFSANDLDYEAETVIRREILPSGKSRAFVNDTPVNLQELQELGLYLIDIHSQHETRELSEEDYQIKIIDAVSGNQQALAMYVGYLKNYRKSLSELSALKLELATSIKEQDYNAFLLEELLAADLIPEEQETLEAELAKLGNVELIRENLGISVALATDETVGIIKNLNEVKTALQKISGLSPEYSELFDRSASVLVELDDIIRETEQLAENLSGDPARMEFVNSKLQTIYNLQKKHQVNSVAELIEIRNALDDKAIATTELGSKITVMENEIQILESELDDAASQIHASRSEAVPILTAKLQSILSMLGMPHARFDIKIRKTATYFHNGKDDIEFLFAANKGSDFGLLKKVASGGELSRIMLAVKSVLAQYLKLPTIIFDEIDTGVSGEIANKMGDIMKQMSKTMQVFAITHLPQIAAKGAAHFKVFKSVSDGKTKSGIMLLSQDERISEIAQMLSGTAVSDSAINHAKALLD